MGLLSPLAIRFGFLPRSREKGREGDRKGDSDMAGILSLSPESLRFLLLRPGGFKALKHSERGGRGERERQRERERKRDIHCHLHACRRQRRRDTNLMIIRL